jgi:hypothetical protein
MKPFAKRVSKAKKKLRDVRVPALGSDVGFLLCGALPDGGHQGLTDGDYLVLLCGNSKGLRKLGKYLLALSDLDTSKDPTFHHHFGLVHSLSGTKIELTVKKNKAAHYDWTR